MNSKTKEIELRLFELQDKEYKAFHQKLMPGFPEKYIIGIRIPVLKKLAGELAKDENIDQFLNDLPHKYYEEYNLQAFIIMKEKDYDKALAEVEKLLPYVDNWATCDSIIPKAFAKNKDKLLPKIKEWLASDQTYTVRFAVGCLMRFYLDDAFRPEYPEAIAAVRSGEYYVNMMIAWYFATALAKQYDSVIHYLTEKRLPIWIHNKTIQKAVESFRVTEKHKEYLKTLRIKQHSEG